MEQTSFIRISTMPDFYSVRHLLRILDNLPVAELSAMENAIARFGEEKEPPLDWTEPASWLDLLPEGSSKALARRIWEESSQRTNPRYLYTEKSLINHYRLAVEDNGVYSLTDDGKDFVRQDEGRVVTAVDRTEGMIVILTAIALNGTSKSAVILPPFEDFVRTHVPQAPSSIYNYLNSRLNNLVNRGYVTRSGNFYDISIAGKRYLEKIDPENRIQRIAQDADKYNEDVRQHVRKTLENMDPFKFEAVVAELFRKMGYTNVQDLQKSHDGGVDVVAEKDFGFGPEKVVIQVKRYKYSLDRAVVSQLRDDIRAFSGATRGIIVTTSDFNKDAVMRANEAGEVPISLIDGEKLINLLIENKFGAKQTRIAYLEFNPQDFDIQEQPLEETQQID